MIPEDRARQRLVDSCHSSREADQELRASLGSAEFIALLVEIAVDRDDHQGDAPMRAAYYLSQASPDLVRPFEGQLLELLRRAEGYGGHVALALGRMRSARARPFIESELRDGTRFDAWLFEEALKEY